MRLCKQFALAIVMSGLAVEATNAGVITGPGGAVSVGIGTGGNLFDPGPFIGFRRNSNGLDPISPGTPHEGWGARVGGIGGRVQPHFLGNQNFVSNGSSFLPASATTSGFINNGSGNALRVDHAFSFVASNVMAIDVKMTNLSGATNTMNYRRLGDWDINPTPFSEIITANAAAGDFKQSTFQGFQSGNPNDAWGSLIPPAGGSFGPADFGAGIEIEFLNVANGASRDFAIYYAISLDGQSEAQLRAQLQALGLLYIISGRSTNTAGQVNSFALGYGFARVIPEPASLTVFGAVAVGGVVTLLRRRRTVVA